MTDKVLTVAGVGSKIGLATAAILVMARAKLMLAGLDVARLESASQKSARRAAQDWRRWPAEKD